VGKILHFGTFDVDNFGDLLFPFITKNSIGPTFEKKLVTVSPTNDRPPTFEDCEAPESFLNLNQSIGNVKGAIIGGGNIIHCKPSYLDSYIKRTRNGFGYSDLWISPTLLLPDSTPIVWNSPGVPGPFNIRQHSIIKEVLQRTNYLSVRDEESRQYLLDVWSDADVVVVPDSAWKVNQLWSKTELEDTYQSMLKRNNIVDQHNTIIFHLNRRYLGGNSLVAIAKHLDLISNLIGSKPILIAFGPCHKDNILAREVSAFMSTDPILLDKPKSIREVASCIAFANAYVGSSMHGAITAATFGVPAICVAERSKPKFEGIVSLTGYQNIVVEDWDEALHVMKNIDFEQFRKDLVTTCEYAQRALQIHWKRIAKELQEFNSGLERNTEFSWSRVVLFQNRIVDSLLSVRDAEQQEAAESLLSAREEEHQKTVELLLSARDTEHQEIIEKLLSTRDAEHQKRVESLLSTRDAEHQKRVDSLLSTRDAEHQKRVESLLSTRDAEHQKRVESLLAARDAEHQKRVASLLTARDAEHQKRVASLLTARDAEHQKRVESLLSAREAENQKRV
jgi:polysaccharide pyruvyl transferase WcaK-like protein